MHPGPSNHGVFCSCCLFFLSQPVRLLVLGGFQTYPSICPFPPASSPPPFPVGLVGEKMQLHRQETRFSSEHHGHRHCGFSSSITARKEKGVREEGGAGSLSLSWQSLFVLAINPHSLLIEPPRPIHHMKTTAPSHSPIFFTRNQSNPRGYSPWASSFVGRSTACAAGGT